MSYCLTGIELQICKRKTVLSMNGFIGRFSNQEASHLARRKTLPRAAEKERFFKVERKWKHEIISKEFVVFGKVTLLRERKGSLRLNILLVLTRKFQAGWLKVTFLGKVETVLRLGSKF